MRPTQPIAKSQCNVFVTYNGPELHIQVNECGWVSVGKRSGHAFNTFRGAEGGGGGGE